MTHMLRLESHSWQWPRPSKHAVTVEVTVEVPLEVSAVAMVVSVELGVELGVVKNVSHVECAVTAGSLLSASPLKNTHGNSDSDHGRSSAPAMKA